MTDDSSKASLIFAKNKSAIVQVKSPTAEGSGVLIRANGLVVTNFHVIEGAAVDRADVTDATCLVEATGSAQ